MPVDFDLRNFRRQRDAGLRALHRGRRGEARTLLLRAADSLYRIAGKSDEPFRSERLRAAGDLVKLARGIGDRAAASPEGGEGGAPPDWELVDRPEITFDSVAGLDGVKEEIRLRMVYPFTHPEAAERHGVRPGGGVLLYGPPGTGKTLLARAVAGEVDASFFSVRPSDVLSKWVGEAEKNVALLFREARSRDRAVIFLDEIEALAPIRGGDSSAVMSRVVPQFLSELEGVHGRGDNALLFIGATNAPWNLDPAILRPGRFDVKVYVGLPDVEAREEILALQFAGRPLACDVDIPRVAELLEGYSGADLRRVAEKAFGDSFLAEIGGAGPGEVDLEGVLRAARSVGRSVRGEQLERYGKWAGS